MSEEKCFSFDGNISLFFSWIFFFLRQYTVHILLWCERVTLMPFEGTHEMVLLLNFVCITRPYTYRYHTYAYSKQQLLRKSFLLHESKEFFRSFHEKDSPFFFPDCRKNSSVESVHLVWQLRKPFFSLHRQKLEETHYICHGKWKYLTVIQCSVVFIPFRSCFGGFFWLYRQLSPTSLTLVCTLYQSSQYRSRKWFNVQHRNEMVIFLNEKKRSIQIGMMAIWSETQDDALAIRPL